jgi:hypothetical protein
MPSPTTLTDKIASRTEGDCERDTPIGAVLHEIAKGDRLGQSCPAAARGGVRLGARVVGVVDPVRMDAGEDKRACTCSGADCVQPTATAAPKICSFPLERPARRMRATERDRHGYLALVRILSILAQPEPTALHKSV